MTRRELVAELAASLGARHEAQFIVTEVLGSAGAPSEQPVSPVDLVTIRALAERRRAGEPLQYVLGHWAFRALDLLVDPRVLIPRPETEQVVEVALKEMSMNGTFVPMMVDLGTGSGAIALSLATELERSCPGGSVWAIDRSDDALAVAAANHERVRHQVGGRILPLTFLAGWWLSALPPELIGTVDLVVSNPPYVATEEWPELPAEVRCEPVGALVAEAGSDGTPGLADVEAVLRQSWEWLRRPGAVVIELAPHQAGAAAALAQALGYLDVEVAPDLAGKPRALVGRVR